MKILEMCILFAFSSHLLKQSARCTVLVPLFQDGSLTKKQVAVMFGSDGRANLCLDVILNSNNPSSSDGVPSLV